ncbi:MAG: twin-arginine translocation signal domain-containing protein, partial [Aquificota bacterium]
MNRRDFIKLSGILGGLLLSGKATLSKLLDLSRDL